MQTRSQSLTSFQYDQTSSFGIFPHLHTKGLVCLGLEPVLGYTRGAKTCQQSRSSLKIPGIRSKFHTEDPQVYDTTLQNLVTWTAWRDICGPLGYLLTYLLTYLLIYLLIYLLTYLLTYLLIYLLTYSMEQSPS